MRELHLDFETCCDRDLSKCGSAAYAEDPSLVVTTMAWAFDNEPVQSHNLPGRALPKAIVDHLQLGGTIHAWNAAFEFWILVYHFRQAVNLGQMSCTMERSLFAGFPGKLEQAGPAIGLGVLKDTTARRQMLKMSRPRDRVKRTFWHDDPAELDILRKYCEQDVRAERAASKALPQLTLDEDYVSWLHFCANVEGVRLDIDLIHKLAAIATDATRRLNYQCTMLTNGEVTSPGTQSLRLAEWCRAQGLALNDVAKDTLTDVLEFAEDAEVPTPVIEVLNIRKRVAKSSIAKLDAMLRTMNTDEVVRGSVQYYAAHTGRSGGRNIQPQNFPRISLKDLKTGKPVKGALITEIIDHVKAGRDLPFFEMFYGDGLEVVSNCLRGCLIPGKDRTFIAYDLSQIEARVLAWLAGQNDLLDVFAKGEDVYEFTSQKLGLGSRQAGKVAVLGLGYGMGAQRFVDHAKKNDLILTSEQAANLVDDWRAANGHIVRLWHAVDTCFKGTIMGSPGPFTKLGVLDPGIVFEKLPAQRGAHHGSVKITLPSGRPLYYRNAHIRMEPDAKGIHYRPTSIYEGVDPDTKRWGEIRTWGSKVVENLVQAVSRDIIFDLACKVETAVPCALTLSVHDELLWEVLLSDDPERCSQLISGLMNQGHDWYATLPVAAEGGILTRYGK